ncbi:18508_t:CDS:2, partial [Funneliformis geosporum]
VRQVIVLDRCLDNSTQNLGLLISENDWIQWYSSLVDIDSIIYNDLMLSSTENE